MKQIPNNVESEIDSLKVDASAEDTADSFMEPKKKRGRKPGSKNKPKVDTSTASGAPGVGPQPLGSSGGDPQSPNFASEVEQNKQFVRPALLAISSLGVKLAETEKAAIGPVEMEILVNSGAACLAQYMPAVLGAHANAIVFLTCFSQWSLQVYLLRQARLQELREEILRRKNAERNVTPPAGSEQSAPTPGFSV